MGIRGGSFGRTGRLATRLLALALFFSLFACTTTETPKPEIATGPPPPGMASVSITRASSFLGSMLAVAIDLDGQRVAGLNVNDTHTMAVKPGRATLTATMFGYPGRYDLSFTAERGKSYRFIVAPRGESFGAGVAGGVILGPVGALIATAAEGNGPFKIELVN